VGAKDAYIARAFIRRFTVRGFYGAALGTVLGAAAMIFLPNAQEIDGQTAGGFLTEFGFEGFERLWLIVIPIFAAAVAYIATRIAANLTLKRLM
jgi:cell division transport system permease protein